MRTLLGKARFLEQREGINKDSAKAPPPNQIDLRLEQAIELKNFRQREYLKMVSRFIQDRCEYVMSHMISNAEVKQAWSEFLRDNRSIVDSISISWRLSPIDIATVDNRFTYKRIHICGSCGHRQFAKCCDGYIPSNRTSAYAMINMKIIPHANSNADDK